ncbi:MAG: FAD-dependent oxidoreductase [Gemmatimonadota bacterium]
MPPTDVTDPQYYHRVVDCQWACPAHTNVPEYIRLIAQGRYTDAYMLNRESNVFPGILGRTCDRPCEPACRRGRLPGEEPVAICRLKRVASDLRDDVTGLLPAVPELKNGKRVACVGAGPASLTVANDLMPLGYDVTIFEKADRPGGLMWSNIPQFRLPPKVLNEEIDTIIDMGVDLRLNAPVESMKALLNDDWDAVFIGSGAPRGKNLELPGRYDTDHIYIGIDWLESVAFEHIDSIEPRVLVIGVGNTAMDCCRTAKRLGGVDVKVMARKPRPYFKASPWELEDAESEGVQIVENHSPTRYVVEDGVLTGMEFEVLRSWEDEMDRATFQTTRPGGFCGGDAAWGPENIIWAVEHGHQAAISIHNHCQGIPLSTRPGYGMNLVSQKMGLDEWTYSNDYSEDTRTGMRHVPLKERLAALDVEVELGFDLEQALKEVERCLNCDVQTHFTSKLCIECDACVDVCPLSCLTIAHEEPEEDLRTRLTAPTLNLQQPLYISDGLEQTGRVMVKDEDLCIHCGLCAERCPTAAWDMRQFALKIPYAGLDAGEHHPSRTAHVTT